MLLGQAQKLKIGILAVLMMAAAVVARQAADRFIQHHIEARAFLLRIARGHSFAGHRNGHPFLRYSLQPFYREVSSGNSKLSFSAAQTQRRFFLRTMIPLLRPVRLSKIAICLINYCLVRSGILNSFVEFDESRAALFPAAAAAGSRGPKSEATLLPQYGKLML